MYQVYCYTNQITNQKYVGCTSWTLERRAGKNGERYFNGGQFGEAIKQYGWSNFLVSVLEDNLTKDQATIREQFWINELNTLFPDGYNLQSGGWKNQKIHPLTKEKMSQSQLKHQHKGLTGLNWYHNDVEEVCVASCPEGFTKGRLPFSKETKEKMSLGKKGKDPWNKGKTGIYSEDTLNKIRQSKLGKDPWNKGKKVKK